MATTETVTCFNVDLTKPGSAFKNGLVFRSSEVAQLKADAIGSTVTPVEVLSDIAAELPE